MFTRLALTSTHMSKSSSSILPDSLSRGIRRMSAKITGKDEGVVLNFTDYSSKSIPGYEAIGPVDQIPAGMSAYSLKSEKDREMLVVNQYFPKLAEDNPTHNIRVFSNSCPHKQARMHLGTVDIEEASVICPKHKKRFPGGLNFDVTCGKAFVGEPGAYAPEFNSSWCLPRYDVLVEDNILYVSLCPKQPISTATSSSVSIDYEEPLKTSPPKFTTAEVTGITTVSEDSLILHLKAIDKVEPTPFYHSFHVAIKLEKDSDFSRDFTPISSHKLWNPSDNSPSFVPTMDVLIKIYPTGRFTKVLKDTVKVGSHLYISKAEPTVHLNSMTLAKTISATSNASSGELGAAAIVNSWKVEPTDTVILVAGGTGITPMLQILEWALEGKNVDHPDTATTKYAKYILMYSSYDADKILCHSRINDLAKAHPTRLSVFHKLTRTEVLPDISVEEYPTVHYGLSKIDSPAIAEAISDTPISSIKRVIVSGPKGMYESMCKSFSDLGVNESDIVDLEA